MQDAYSLRCMPQVHGATRDALAYVRATVEREVNAATDNPLVLVEDELLVSGGNFHGQPRRRSRSTRWRSPSPSSPTSASGASSSSSTRPLRRPPAFLAADSGLNSGFMIAQYVAASLVSENKVLCHPASVDSIPSSAGQEDHVSMGNASGLKAFTVLGNVERALAIELLAACQGVDSSRRSSRAPACAPPARSSAALSPRLREDRPLAGTSRRSPPPSATGR